MIDLQAKFVWVSIIFSKTNKYLLAKINFTIWKIVGREKAWNQILEAKNMMKNTGN